MKRIFYLLILAVIISSCRKDKSAYLTAPDGNYQPDSKGSTWKYINTDDVGSEWMSYTFNGASATFSGTVYKEAIVKYESDAPTYPGDPLYFYHSKGGYWLRSTGSDDLLAGIEIEYLRDNVPVNASWEGTGKIQGVVPTKYTTTIKEKGVTKTVRGKVYTSVIHSQLTVFTDAGQGFEKFVVYDFYAADKVGIIKMDLEVDLGGIVIATSDLEEYSIK